MHLLYLDDAGSASNSNEQYLVLGGVSVYEAQSHWITRELDRLAEDTTAYFTDDWAPYEGIAKAGQIHETVNHSLGEYVRGDVHVNSVENVWSLLKRSIIGAYHHVNVKHLDAYLDELEWRFNNRDNPWLFRDILLKLLDAEHVEYKELVA
ncbi:MAG: IS1595 family transposase [Truepera sp.]|nr:IS1595 family transposase [Truepera sp.]